MHATEKITSLAQAIEFFQRTMAARPERDGLASDRAVIEGRWRKHPVLYIGHNALPTDPDRPASEFDLPGVEMPETPEASLARDIVGMLAPLKLLNPVRAAFGLGRGTGSLVPSFGIPLNPDAGHSPACTITLDQALAQDPPCPETSGLIPGMRERPELIKDRTPAWFRIGPPDMQGPYNIAHAVIGEDALIAPYTNPDGFHEFMGRVTRFWIETHRSIAAWIGRDRLPPMEQSFVRIAECSCNLISRAMYREFVLPYDTRIGETFGPMQIHTCSGPHVFHETLDLLPDVRCSEAGFIAKTAAGYTPVDEALAAIGGRPIILHIGQELPAGKAYETIRNDIDTCADHPRMYVGSYTGMHRRNRDTPMICKMHRDLDDYWARKFA